MTFTDPEITFVHGNMLLRNDTIIDAADTSPEFVYDVVDDNALAIHDRIHQLDELVTPDIPMGRETMRPIILVARLALLNNRDEALTKRGLESPSSFHTSFDDITDTFSPYWRMVASTEFVPEAQERKTGDHFAGIWLGVRATELSATITE